MAELWNLKLRSHEDALKVRKYIKGSSVGILGSGDFDAPDNEECLILTADSKEIILNLLHGLGVGAEVLSRSSY